MMTSNRKIFSPTIVAQAVRALVVTPEQAKEQQEHERIFEFFRLQEINRQQQADLEQAIEQQAMEVVTDGNFNTADAPQESTMTYEELMEMGKTVNEMVESSNQEAIKWAEDTFKMNFGRGDIVVFPNHQEKYAHKIKSSLPALVAHRIRVSKLLNTPESVTVLNGDYVSKAFLDGLT